MLLSLVLCILYSPCNSIYTIHTHTHTQPHSRLLLSEGYEPDILYTSRLKRAVKSTWTILNALQSSYLPVYKSWRLNERNYGALTGLKKIDAANELGFDVVQAWYVLYCVLCFISYHVFHIMCFISYAHLIIHQHSNYTHSYKSIGVTHSRHVHHQCQKLIHTTPVMIVDMMI